MTPLEIGFLILAGVVGALVRLITRNDGSLKLPYLSQGRLYLGCISAIIIGGVIGVIVDGSFVTAFLGAYTGHSLLDKLVLKNTKYTD